MTRENYIKNLYSMINDAEDMGLYDEDVESLQFAIEALEQELILDKIRAEIEQEYTKFRNKSDMWDERACGLGMALEIIDKYKSESEE